MSSKPCPASHLWSGSSWQPPCRAKAQSGEEPFQLSWLTGPIELDGHLNEPAWDQVPTLPLVMYSPTTAVRQAFGIDLEDPHLLDGATAFLAARLEEYRTLTVP